MNSKVKVLPESVTGAQMSQALHVPDIFNDSAWAPPQPVSLFEAVAGAIGNFHHPLGMHTTELYNWQKLIITFPPGLTRLQQLQFYEQLYERIFEAKFAYWNLAIAQTRQEFVSVQVDLAKQLSRIEQRKLEVDQTTIFGVRSAELRELQIRESSLRSEYKSDFLTVELATRKLAEICGVPYRNYEAIEKPNDFDSHYLDSDTARLLIFNPKVLLHRYAWLKASKGKGLPIRYINPNVDSPNLALSTADIVKQVETEEIGRLVSLNKRIQIARQAMDLVNQRIEIQREHFKLTEDAVRQGESTEDESLLAQLNLEKSKLDRELLKGEIQILKTKYEYQIGELPVGERIHFPDFWLARMPGYCHSHVDVAQESFPSSESRPLSMR